MDLPVFLFTGFLESGKTTFIQEALEGDDFNMGERTLLIVCEEGMVEYQPDKFFGKNVFIEIIDDQSQLTEEYLNSLVTKHMPERVIIEYNGMWQLEALFNAIPNTWVLYQEMCFFDSRTFLSYNQNMRQLVFEKLKTAEMVVFNRFENDFDKMEFHQIVRVANRKSTILYEYEKDNVELDTIEDPLPFNLEKEHIDIEPDWYAPWYRDINEEQDKYEGKELTLTARIVLGGGLAEDELIFGRHIMTCCVDDIEFAGLVGKSQVPINVEHGGWAELGGIIKNEFHPMYGEEGPVLHITKLEEVEPLEPEVATF